MHSTYSNGYALESEGKFNKGNYQFEIRFLHKVSEPALLQGSLSEEFIEDEIDNSKNLNYLEEVALEKGVAHLNDSLKLPPARRIGNIKYWFRDAKKQLDLKRQNGTNN